MAKVTVVGLGPGPLGQMTLETYEILFSGARIFLRTAEHPCVPELKNKGLLFTTFDDLYESCSDFQEVYEQISLKLINAATKEGIVYAVPGHPRAAEQSVAFLLKHAANHGIEVEVKSAMSFLDPIFSGLGIDPIEGVSLVDGSATLPVLSSANWNIICQVYSRLIASERKLDLMDYYPDEFEVYILNSMGVQGKEEIVKVPLYELDRYQNFGPLTSLAIPPNNEDKPSFDWGGLLQVMSKLRSPNGCPWDKEQTHQSLRPYLLEETYEVLEALEQDDMHKLCEELGDLLLQIVFHAQLAQEKQEFSITDVIRELVEKLVRRHPHVFANAQANCAEEVVATWERVKEEEIGGRKSVFDGLTKGLPAMLYARKVQARAAKVGFDWDDISGPVAKVQEELAELVAADTPELRAEELGDLLFSVVNVSRFIDADPELSLRSTIDKFIYRFSSIEEECTAKDMNLEQLSVEEMNRIWEKTKNE